MHFARTSRSPAETALIGRALGRMLRPGDVVLIDGPLGAGKTTLTRAVAEGMDLDTAPIASPTFVMVHEYPAGRSALRADAQPGPPPRADSAPPLRPPADAPSLIHVDAYRLRGDSDLETIGWDDVMTKVDSGRAALLMEWAERLGDTFMRDRDAARIRIEHISEDQREFFFHLPDAWSSRAGFADLTAREPTRCPVTGDPVLPDSPTYPFSSERARLADLSRWFSGSYQITRPMEARDLEEGVD